MLELASAHDGVDAPVSSQFDPGLAHHVPTNSMGGTPRRIGAWSQFGRLDLHRPPARGGWADCPPKFPRPELLRIAGRVEREIATKSADVHTYYTHVCSPNPYSATPYPPPAAARAWFAPGMSAFYRFGRAPIPPPCPLTPCAHSAFTRDGRLPCPSSCPCRCRRAWSERRACARCSARAHVAAVSPGISCLAARWPAPHAAAAPPP